MTSTLSNLCRGTGILEGVGGPKVKLQSTEVTLLHDALEAKASIKQSRRCRRRALLPHTYATRRGLMLLYPNSFLNKLGENKHDVGDIEASILADSNFFSAEFERWVNAVLGNCSSDESEHDDEITELPETKASQSIFLSADAILANSSNKRNKKIRPGLSARRYLINLTEGAESKLNINWKGKGYVSESTLFEANAANPTLKRKVKADLSEIPEPYSLSHFSTASLPLHVFANDFSLGLPNDEEDYDLFPAEKEDLKIDSVQEDHAIDAGNRKGSLPQIKKAIDYGKLPLDAKRSLLVDRLIKHAIMMAIRKHKELFEVYLKSQAINNNDGDGRNKHRLSKQNDGVLVSEELTTAPSKDFSDALTAISYDQLLSRKKAKLKIRGRHDQLVRHSLDPSSYAPFSVYLRPRMLGGKPRPPMFDRFSKHAFSEPAVKSDNFIQFEREDAIHFSASDLSSEDDEEDLVAPELINYSEEPPSTLLSDQTVPVSQDESGQQTLSSNLPNNQGSVLGRLFAEGSSVEMKQILQNIPSEVFDAIENDLVGNLAQHANRIAKSVLAKPGNGKILEKDVKLAQDMWTKFLLEPIPQAPTLSSKKAQDGSFLREQSNNRESSFPRFNTEKSRTRSQMNVDVGHKSPRDDSSLRHGTSIQPSGPHLGQSAAAQKPPSHIQTFGFDALPEKTASDLSPKTSSRTVVTREFKGAFDSPLHPQHSEAKHYGSPQTREGDLPASPLKHSRQTRTQDSGIEPSLKELKFDSNAGLGIGIGPSGVAVSGAAKPPSGMSLPTPVSQHRESVDSLQSYQKPDTSGTVSASSRVQSSDEATPPEKARHPSLLPTIPAQFSGANRPVLLGVSVSSEQNADHGDEVEEGDAEAKVVKQTPKKVGAVKKSTKHQPLSQQDSSLDAVREDTFESTDGVGAHGKKGPRAAAPKQKLKKMDSTASTVSAFSLDEEDDDTGKPRKKGGRAKDSDGESDGDDEKTPAASKQQTSKVKQPVKVQKSVKRTDSKAKSHEKSDDDEAEEFLDDETHHKEKSQKKEALHKVDSKQVKGGKQKGKHHDDDFEINLEHIPDDGLGGGDEDHAAKVKAKKEKKPKKEPKEPKPFIVGMPEETKPKFLEGEDGRKGKKKKGKKKKGKDEGDEEFGVDYSHLLADEAPGEDGGSDSSDEYLKLEGAVEVQVNFKRGKKEATKKKPSEKKPKKVETPPELPPVAEEEVLNIQQGDETAVLVAGETPATANLSRRKSTKQSEQDDIEFVYVPRSPSTRSRRTSVVKTSQEKAETPKKPDEEPAPEAEPTDESEKEEPPPDVNKISKEELIKRRREAVEAKRRERQAQLEEDKRREEDDAARKDAIQKEFEREQKEREEAAKAEYEQRMREKLQQELEEEERLAEAERQNQFGNFVAEQERAKRDEFKNKFQEELKRRRTSRALRRFDSGTLDGMASFGFLTDEALMASVIDDDQVGDLVETGEIGPMSMAKRMSMQAHKLMMAERRKLMEAERRAILLGAQRLTASALARKRLMARRLEYWGLMNHQIRFTRAFVWSYFSLLQWLRIDNTNEKLPKVEKKL